MTRQEWLKANGYKKVKGETNLYSKLLLDGDLSLVIKLYNSGEIYSYIKFELDPLNELDKRYFNYLGSKFDLLKREVEKMKEESE